MLTLASAPAFPAAVFSLVDTALIKPLPYPDSDRLVTVYDQVHPERTSLVAPARIRTGSVSRSFVAISRAIRECDRYQRQQAERLEGRQVTPGFFAVYGTQPLVGRTFIDAEEQSNGPGAVVISERFWSRRFQRDAATIGRALVIGQRPYQIVGVLPGTFTAAATDVWLPAQLGPQCPAVSRGTLQRRRASSARRDPRGWRARSCFRAGSTREEFPKSDGGWSTEIRSLKEVRIGDSRRGLVLVFGAVASLWIIAVASIAGLTLVQVQRRTRELAIRAARSERRASA